MSSFEAILLGIIQGLTEFFPVSSSTHLALIRSLYHIKEDRFFDLICHLGTLFALMFFLRKDLVTLIKNPKELVPYFWALLPLPLFYILLKKMTFIPSTLSFRGLSLIFTGCFLLLAAFWKNHQFGSKKIQDMVWIGSMQGLALIPGFSRSGWTISMGCVRGFVLPDAVQFSFILSIPTIFGGVFVESIQKTDDHLLLPFSSYLLGFLFAFLFGLIAVHWIFQMKEKKTLAFFAIYCMIIGTYLIFYF